MSKYTIRYKTSNWYCECCGTGSHWELDLLQDGKQIWGTSRNDQFGGTYRSGDDETISIYDPTDFVKGMEKALLTLGHTVDIEEHLDDTDPYYEYDEMEQEDE